LSLLLSACGSDSAKPTANQAKAQAADAALRPPQITAQPSPVMVSAGATATFQVNAAGNDLQYQWLREGEPVPQAHGASYTTPPTWTTDNGGHYSVRVRNANGEAVSQAVLLTVNEAMFSN
jgi:membrane carboxypeptidase/penicillin-binding protein PbpC